MPLSSVSYALPRRPWLGARGRAPDAALPPGPRLPTALQTALWFLAHERQLLKWRDRYGPVFTVRVLGFGTSVCVGEPELVKQVFTADPAVLHSGDLSPSGNVIGRGSLLALDEDEHLRHRRLILPAFHGERLAAYDAIIGEEVDRCFAQWPIGVEFPTFERFIDMTLRTIVRAVFGAEGPEIDELMVFLPRGSRLGQMLAPFPFLWHRSWGPWAEMMRLRGEFERIVGRVVERARSAGEGDEPTDIISMMALSRFDDGTQMTLDELIDEALTLVVGGHLSTASTLAWLVERLRRHPDLFERLAAEAEAGGDELRTATILEVQRTRPVSPSPSRYTMVPFELGGYVIPPRTSVLVPAVLSHNNPDSFPEPERFNPDRFLGARPGTYTWIGFGGGRRRCIGAAFAQRQLDIVLRELVQRPLAPTDAPGEGWHTHGIAFSPSKGAVALLDASAAA